MFFIKSGEVAYVIPKFLDFKFQKIKEGKWQLWTTHLKAYRPLGYYFGETDLLFYGEIRKYTLKAVKTCELYVLNKKEFKQIFFMEFRDIGMEIVNLAYRRKFRTKKAYQEAITFLGKGGSQEIKSYVNE